MNVKNLAICLVYNKPLIDVSYIIINTKSQKIRNLFGDLLRANKPWWAMSWNRPQSINPVISSHPKEGTFSQNSLSENGAKISGFCNPEAHLIISIITLRKKPFPSGCRVGGKSQTSLSPVWQSWRCLVSASFSLLLAFFRSVYTWEGAG